jgi:hypothetical protein
MLRPLALCALAALLLPGCFVEAEEPTVCKTLTDQTIGPLLPGVADFDTTYDYAFDNSLLNFGDKQVDTEIQALSLTFTLKSGASNLDFIQSGSVALAPPSGTGPEVKILAYTRNAPVEKTLILGAGDPINITDYMDNGNVHAHVALHGSFPASAQITFDVKACLYAKVHYDYL